MKITRFLLQHKIMIPVILLTGIWFYWVYSPPGSLFPDDYATPVYDCNGSLLRVFLSRDEQVRFPWKNVTLPEKYVVSLVTFEDKRFYRHDGVDLWALLNATITNILSGERKRGGSTITMQVARLAAPKSRTLFNKLLECAAAFKYSVHFSKQQILQIYAAHVPMGGNIVGIQAASWRYFGKPVAELTWAEAALFVVLPNSPSAMNLGKQREKLLQKRNILLQKLYDNKIIDRLTLDISSQEPLPPTDNQIPFLAPHFCYNVTRNVAPGRAVHTTLDAQLQQQVESMLAQEHRYLRRLGIANISALVVETATGRVRAYIGSQDFFDDRNGGQVDGILAPRSTGSLLKPFLAAKAMDKGPYTINSLLTDAPTWYGTFAPQNASKTFAGLVTMEDMLVKSLNVPAVRLLYSYGVRDFYLFLLEAGFSNLFRGAEGYGLSLILGGAEASLWELTQLYASLGNLGRVTHLTLYENEGAITPADTLQLFSRGSAWLVLNSLRKLARPGSEFYWTYFDNQTPVAWKTGTSYGQKDGWAIGVNRQWTIGVWIGNFKGSGNAAISGAKSAAPLMFTLFNSLTRRDEPVWFEKPVDDLVQVQCCEQSGYPTGPNCPSTMMLERPACSYIPGLCPFHRRFLVNKKTGKAVCSLCWHGVDTTHVNLFIVSPQVKELLEKSGQVVAAIPQHAENCPQTRDENRIEIVYPVNGIKIFVPRDLDGAYEQVVLSARHQRSDARLFWFLDSNFLGETTLNHQFTIDLAPGAHVLTVQDDEGFIKKVRFSAYKRE